MANPKDPFADQRYLMACAQLRAGQLEREQANYEAALQAFELAEEIFSMIGRDIDENRARLDIASVYADTGQYDSAEKLYLSVISAFKKLEVPSYACAAIGNLGNIYKDQGRYSQALRCYEHVIDFYESEKDARNQMLFMGNMAIVYQQRGEYGEAISLYEQSYRIHKEYGDLRGQAIVLGNLGTVYQQQEQFQRALDCCLEALQIFQQLEDKKNVGIFKGNCGEAFLRLQDRERGIVFLKEAIVICDEVLPMAGGFFRGALAQALAEKGDINRALSLCAEGEESVAAYPLEYATFLCRYARIQIVNQNLGRAEELREKAERIAMELGVQPDSSLVKAIRLLRADMGLDNLLFTEPLFPYRGGAS